MKSLTSINELLHNLQEIKSSISNIFDLNAQFPLHIEGTQGSLFSFFVSESFVLTFLKTVQYDFASREAKIGFPFTPCQTPISNGTP